MLWSFKWFFHSRRLLKGTILIINVCHVLGISDDIFIALKLIFRGNNEVIIHNISNKKLIIWVTTEILKSVISGWKSSFLLGLERKEWDILQKLTAYSLFISIWNYWSLSLQLAEFVFNKWGWKPIEDFLNTAEVLAKELLKTSLLDRKLLDWFS